MKVLLSHSGKQHSYHVAKALDDLGYLEKFYTSGYITSRRLQDVVTKSGNQYWSRRFIRGIHGNKVESNWRFEIKENVYNRIYGQSPETVKAVFDRDTNFDNYIAGKMHQLKGDLFWGFQGSCFNSLQAARRNGKMTICELSGVHAPTAMRLLKEEETLQPEWSESLKTLNFPDEYYERMISEPHLADIVIGASPFTLQSLHESGISPAKTRLLPLGFEIDHIEFRLKARPVRPFRLAFVGRITQSKGIRYLLEAIKQFDSRQVELHLIGYVQGSEDELNRYKPYFVRHEPMAQYELFRKYQEFDAFILPSICEGFGLALLEAMAAGLPAITTPNSIGPELIEDDYNGYIVPIRDTNAITLSIRRLLSKSDIELSEMRRNARETAKKFSWDAYGIRLKEVLDRGFHEQ